MTRPDVEGILRDNGDVPTVANLCRYILVLETGLNTVLPCTVALGINTRTVALRRKFDAFVARWTP